jgi:hypothetical protein
MANKKSVAERKIHRGMAEIMEKTGHECPKASRKFCHKVLHIYWKPGQPAIDDALFNERMQAYNNGTLAALLKRVKQ